MTNEHDPSDFLMALMDSLSNDIGFCIVKPDPEHFHVHKIVIDDLIQMSKDLTLYHVVSLYDRPGAAYFANYLEYTYFTPDTPENDLMNFITFRWEDHHWSILSVPIEYKYACETACEMANLRLADGVPIIMGGNSLGIVASMRPTSLSESLKDQVRFFPLNGPNVFTLENKNGSIMYEGRGGQQDARNEEIYKLNKLWEKHHQNGG
jgi:hypothetical protein